MKLNILENSIFRSQLTVSHAKKKYFWVAVYIDKENIVLEIEKRVLGQNGVGFQVKIIENIKLCKHYNCDPKSALKFHFHHC